MFLFPLLLAGNSLGASVPGTYAYPSNKDMNDMLNKVYGVFTVLPKKDADVPDYDTAPPLQLEALIPDPAYAGGTAIRYLVREPQEITLKLCAEDVKEIETLAEGFKTPGTYWVALPYNRLAPGHYTCRLEGNSTDVIELLLSRQKEMVN
jgi:hypothetical protein